MSRNPDFDAVTIKKSELEQLQEAVRENERLWAAIAHVGGFLDGMAERIDGWKRWDSGEGDVGSFAIAAQDCRTLAAAIKRKRQ